MKRKLLSKIALVLSVSLFAIDGSAQDSAKNVKQKVVDENGKPSLITFNENSTYKSTDSKKVLTEQLELKDNSTFSIMNTESDKSGFSHEKFQLYHQGVKVEYATYSLHSKNGKITSMSGEYYDIQNTAAIPTISQETAFKKALNQIGASTYLWENPENASKIGYHKPEGELVFLPSMIDQGEKNTNQKARLAYKFDIYATSPVSRGDLYIDAITGEALYYNATIKHLGEYSHAKSSSLNKVSAKNTNAAKTFFVSANAATRYSGTQSIQTALSGSSYILSDATRGNGVQTFNMKKGTNYSAAVNFTDSDNNWTATEFNNANKDNAALDAHWGAEKTYDYFSAVHGRNSYDNIGAAIKSYVHYDLAYDNAYWNGSVMTYGDGSDTYFDALTSIDVAGHEIGHAVCEKTANLAYQKESGAMNEAFSDIWGACIEYYASPGKSTWLIGEDIERRAGRLALRSMSDPKSEGQPDTYGGTNWKLIECGTPTQANDYCGVHTNSGVLNHWFYILTIGKSGTNDIGNSYNVTGINIDKAAKIAYRLESVYLSANSTYANARTYGIQAATDLYGAGSPEVIATTNAFYAVGVGSAYGVLNYCASKGNSVADEYISKVQLGTINNTTTGGSGYTDYTSISTNLTKGVSSTITITPTWPGTKYNEGYAVWIDYNKNGDFSDAGELVWSKAASQTTPVTGSFTVPTSAANGATRMRVAMKYNAIPTSCEAISYGEVEDYTVNIAAGAADTTAPTIPANLAASGTTTTATNLTWSASSDNVGVTGYNVYQGTTLKSSVTGTSYTVTGLVPNTAYTFTVKAKDLAGNISASSNVVNVTTLNNTLVYCTSKGNSVADEYIDYVSIGGINNTTAGNAGYGNFTNLVGNLPYGSNTILFSAGFSGTAYTEYWKIWIDYNQNGTFETAEEMVSGSSSSSANLTSTFTVPTSALAGPTRMRVSMKYNAAQTACEAFSYGEVEDYTVNIGAAAITTITTAKVAIDLGNEDSISDVVMYPNPADNILNVRMADSRKGTYRLINFLGQQVDAGKLSESGINVNKLGAGVYILEVNDGQKTVAKKFVKN
ncbi:Por secretion system C-terminal sorting domain-containing protein [Flavobacterium gillisiae]|uniref:Por secretion system C-terminal sorting domain-containing protein n=1 Tax=Flavobacterium gillisiae TaxID=150146 RepID=A0A1H3Z1A1_9FLAO|nr:M4 family metallopeptidase [Flavobacterium gillisiae]SEA17457.1 Por secretion system C-terminal sorting domain-containing protein [Flavobacterium gillisiae]